MDIITQIVFRNVDNLEVWEHIIDKKFDHILLHRFMPHSTIEWIKGSLSIAPLKLEQVLFRRLEVDVSINLELLHEILQLNPHYLHIYQFDKPIPGTLVIENLPERDSLKILAANGLQHIVFNELEDTIVQSVDQIFLRSLVNNPTISSHIVAVI